MPPVGFEPTISAGERPYTYTLDRAATGSGNNNIDSIKYHYRHNHNLREDVNYDYVFQL